MKIKKDGNWMDRIISLFLCWCRKLGENIYESLLEVRTEISNYHCTFFSLEVTEEIKIHIWKVNLSKTCETLCIKFCNKIKRMLNLENIWYLSVWKKLIVTSVLLLKRHKDEKLQNHGFKCLRVFFCIVM